MLRSAGACLQRLILTQPLCLKQVQREYAEQAKQETRTQTSVGACDAVHAATNRSPEKLPNWKKLTPKEIEQARRHMAREREAALSRHAVELKELDAQQHEIDKLERLITAFAQKHGASRRLAS
jgi:hypothetical protein